jgi:hypothetical protein
MAGDHGEFAVRAAARADLSVRNVTNSSYEFLRIAPFSPYRTAQ